MPLWCAQDIIQAGVVQPFGAPVAILYSETTDIWRGAEGPIDKKSGKTELGPLRGDQNSAMSDFRTAYLALTHAGLAPDVLIEGDPYASPSPLAIHELT